MFIGKFKTLTLGITNRVTILMSVYNVLFDIKTDLAYVNGPLDSSHKMAIEMVKSLSETQSGLKASQDELHEMQSKNVLLTKEYTKALKFSYFIMYVASENTMKQVEFFHPRASISREQIHYEQEIMGVIMVIIVEKSTS